MRVNRALFTGRFQPPSVAHVATVHAILELWEYVTIGVVDPMISSDEVHDSRWSQHVDMIRGGYSPGKFVFSAAEVVQMWAAWIKHSGLEGRATSVVMPRIYLPSFSQLFPASSYDLVYPRPLEGDIAEQQRVRLFPVLLGRQLFEVVPDSQLHNTDIRGLVKGGRSWGEFIPAGAYDVFLVIKGPARILAAMGV